MMIKGASKKSQPRFELAPFALEALFPLNDPSLPPGIPFVHESPHVFETGEIWGKIRKDRVDFSVKAPCWRLLETDQPTNVVVFVVDDLRSVESEPIPKECDYIRLDAHARNWFISAIPTWAGAYRWAMRSSRRFPDSIALSASRLPVGEMRRLFLDCAEPFRLDSLLPLEHDELYQAFGAMDTVRVAFSDIQRPSHLSGDTKPFFPDPKNAYEHLSLHHYPASHEYEGEKGEPCAKPAIDIAIEWWAKNKQRIKPKIDKLKKKAAVNVDNVDVVTKDDVKNWKPAP